MDEEEVSSPFSFVGAAGSSTRKAAGQAAGDEWESVPPQAAPPTSEGNGRGWELVAVGTSAAAFDDCSVFPPSLHEGLHLSPDPDPNPTPIPLHQHHDEAVGGLGESSLPPPRGEEAEEEGEMPMMQHRLSDSARRLIGSGLEVIRSKICLWRGGGLDCAIGGGVWSVVALAGLVGSLMYLSRRHRREKELLLLLIQEKDQMEAEEADTHLMNEEVVLVQRMKRLVELLRISQLLHQIALMNEIMAAHHRITILRRL